MNAKKIKHYATNNVPVLFLLYNTTKDKFAVILNTNLGYFNHNDRITV